MTPLNITDPDPERDAIAKTVARERIRRGWSKEYAARQAGVSSITWKRVEDGERVQDAKLGLVLSALNIEVVPADEPDEAAAPLGAGVGGQGKDADSLLYRRPDGMSDAAWERLKNETREYLEWLIDRAARER